jgi:spore maturation protein SpmB
LLRQSERIYKEREGGNAMLVLGILLIIGGLVGYFYTLNQMGSFEHSLSKVWEYFGALDISSIEIYNKAAIIFVVLGVIFLIIGIVKLAKD